MASVKYNYSTTHTLSPSLWNNVWVAGKPLCGFTKANCGSTPGGTCEPSCMLFYHIALRTLINVRAVF